VSGKVTAKEWRDRADELRRMAMARLTGERRKAFLIIEDAFCDEQAAKMEAEEAVEEKPLPCPFCGAEPEWVDEYTTLICHNRECAPHVEATGGTKSEATRRWNTRAPQSSSPCGRVHASEEFLAAVDRWLDYWDRRFPGTDQQLLMRNIRAHDPRNPAPAKDLPIAPKSPGSWEKAVEETPSEMPTKEDWQALANMDRVHWKDSGYPFTSSPMMWHGRMTAFARRMAAGEIEAVPEWDLASARASLDTLRRERDEARADLVEKNRRISGARTVLNGGLLSTKS
jgi:hypothetical protein